MKFLLIVFFLFISLSSFGKAKGGERVNVGASLKKLQAELRDLKLSQRTAYVNLIAVIEGTKKGQKIKKQLEKSAEAAKRRFQTKEADIKKEEAALKKEAPLLSEQARAQRIQNLQEKFMNYQRETKNKELELQNLQNRLMNPIFEQIKKVAGEIAKKEGYRLVENIGSEVLWVDPSLDLTKKVTLKFNKKYK